MKQYTFEQDRNLLKSVITRQAGEWKKGLIELAQNAYDATRNCENPRITYDLVSEKEFIISDNGDGMGLEEIETYFRTFGLTSKTESDMGEFGMGRGQIMTICYDHESDRMVGSIEVITKKKDGKIYRIFNIDIPSLSFSVEEIEHEELIETSGTVWKLKIHDDELIFYFDHREIKTFMGRNLQYLPMDTLFICKGNPIWVRKDLDNLNHTVKYEDDEVIIITSDIVYDMRFYERGIFIQCLQYPGMRGLVISKKPIKLNFARNKPIGNDERWLRITEKLHKVFAETIKKLSAFEYTSETAEMTAILISKGFDDMRDIKIFRDSTERTLSYNDILKNDKIITNGRHKDGTFQKKSGILVLLWNHHLENLLNHESIEILERDAIFQFVFEDDKISTEDNQNALQYLERFTSGVKVEIGKTDQDIRGYTDKLKIYLNTNSPAIDMKLFKRSKIRFFSLVFGTLSHELAHIHFGTEEHDHDASFWRVMTNIQHNMMIKFLSMQYSRTNLDDCYRRVDG